MSYHYLSQPDGKSYQLAEWTKLYLIMIAFEKGMINLAWLLRESLESRN